MIVNFGAPFLSAASYNATLGNGSYAEQYIIEETGMTQVELDELISTSQKIEEGLYIEGEKVMIDESILAETFEAEEIEELIDNSEMVETDEYVESTGEINFSAFSATYDGKTFTMKLTGKEMKAVIAGGYILAGILAIASLYTAGTSAAVAATIVGTISSVSSLYLTNGATFTLTIPRSSMYGKYAYIWKGNKKVGSRRAYA